MEILTDMFRNRIRLTEERIEHILKRSEMKGQKLKINIFGLKPKVFLQECRVL